MKNSNLVNTKSFNVYLFKKKQASKNSKNQKYETGTTD